MPRAKRKQCKECGKHRCDCSHNKAMTEDRRGQVGIFRKKLHDEDWIAWHVWFDDFQRRWEDEHFGDLYHADF